MLRVGETRETKMKFKFKRQECLESRVWAIVKVEAEVSEVYLPWFRSEHTFSC